MATRMQNLRSHGRASKIADADEFHREGYVWDVALAKAASYWATDPWGNLN